jgi:hypothetical protein
MRRSIAIVSMLAVLSVSAAAAECPVESLSPSEVEKLIVAAPTCEQGLKIFESCGMGGMSDVILGGVVIEKCEAVFEGKLSAAQRRSYDRANKACDRKYARETGSEYRSLTAFCSAAVAGRMAKQFSKAATPAKK